MSRHSRTVEETTISVIPATMNQPEGARVMHVQVCYVKGGMNYASGQRVPRSYWLTATIENRQGYGVGFTMFANGSKFLEHAKVFSAKRLAAIEPSREDIEAVKRVAFEQDTETQVRRAHHRGEHTRPDKFCTICKAQEVTA